MSQLIYEYNGPQGVIKHKNVTNSSKLVLAEADKLGVDWKIIPNTQLIECCYEGQKRTFHHQIPYTTSALANFSCNDKNVTSSILQNNGISVPKGFRVTKSSSDDYLLSIYEDLQKPLVVKPADGSWGDSISVNVTDYNEYLKAVELAFNYSSKSNATVVVEEMFVGTEYRILATREKVIGVLYRRPASVVGNGVDSIKKLIKQKNLQSIRDRSNGTTSHLKIKMDENMSQLLAEHAMTFEFVPAKEQRVFLRLVSNISQGGDAIDVTDKVHKSVKAIALKAINAIHGLSFAGIDFMSTNITKPQTTKTYTIIEINESPGFDIHDSPYRGKNRHAAREFLFLMFPNLSA